MTYIWLLMAAIEFTQENWIVIEIISNSLAHVPALNVWTWGPFLIGQDLFYLLIKVEKGLHYCQVLSYLDFSLEFDRDQTQL